tara:strand:+ start:157 stop:528 length:372 start_codon:yes stop_codon:yes gene_type:complete
MDSRTQRRINRAQVREKILEKEAEKKQRRRVKILEKEAETKQRRGLKIKRTSHNEMLIGRCEEYKRVVRGYQSQVLSQMRVIDRNQSEIADLKTRLKKINDELCEWKKWFNSLGVHDNMMNGN